MEKMREVGGGGRRENREKRYAEGHGRRREVGKNGEEVGEKLLPR